MNVNGYYCRNCADVELAKRHLDPAKPGREYVGGEVYVPPPDDRGELGVNRAQSGRTLGGRLDVRA